MATPVSGADTWLTLNGASLSFRRGDENLDAKAVEYGLNAFRITRDAPDDLEIRVDEEPLDTERYGRWNWKPGGFAGLYQIQVRAPGLPPQTAHVRVLPSKLSFERYRQMLEDISRISEDLVFQLRSPGSEKASIGAPQERSSALREYKLIRVMMRNLTVVMAQIGRSPHRVLAETSEPRLLHEIGRFSGNAAPLSGPMLALPATVGRSLGVTALPENWAVQYGALTYDVYENRLLKHFLWRQLLARIHSIEERASSEIERRCLARTFKLRQGWEDDESEEIKSLEVALEDCRLMAQRCTAWGDEPFLRSVRPLTLASQPTQVLQKHPHYSRFYRIYLSFQQELRLSLENDRYLTTLSLRKMSELYETWSVFQLTHLILGLLGQAGYRIISGNGFFDVRDDQFHLEVSRDAAIELAKDDVRVAIRYEPTYPPVNSVSSGLVSAAPYQLTPDMSIESWQNGQVFKVLIFDAKYRTMPDGASQIYREEDITKMAHYYNTIRWKPQNPRQRPQRVVSSAYILYPGSVLEHDGNEPEVGALPLIPQEISSARATSVLSDILKHAHLK